MLLCTQQLSYLLCPFLLCLKALFPSLIARLWQPGAQRRRHGAKFSQAVGLDFQSKPCERVLWITWPVLRSTAQCFSHAHAVHITKTHWGLAAAAVSLLCCLSYPQPQEIISQSMCKETWLCTVHRVCTCIEEIAF